MSTNNEDTIEKQQLGNPFAAVAFPEFRCLIGGRFLFIMGVRMMGSLLGWWVYSLTNSPLAIGMVGLSEFLPAFGMALYAGHIIDTNEKKGLLMRGVLCYLLAILILLGLAIAQTRHIFSTTLTVNCIYAVVFFTGILRSFVGPSLNVMLSTIVPKSLIQNATTWNQGAWLSASVIGHALGGLLIALLGNAGTLGINAASVALAVLLFTRIKPKPPKETSEKKTWDSVKEGLRFVLQTRELLAALSLDLFAVLFGGAVAMIPVYARDILMVGPKGFGLLNAAADIGAMCCIITMAISPLRRSQGRILLFVIGGFGITIIVFGLSNIFWLSFFALLLGGLLDGVSVVVRGTILQLKTPDQLKGRVMSVSSMFINSSNELGQFESGVAARVLGVVPSVVFGGCMTLLVVGTTWFKSPSLRKLEY